MYLKLRVGNINKNETNFSVSIYGNFSQTTPNALKDSRNIQGFAMINKQFFYSLELSVVIKYDKHQMIQVKFSNETKQLVSQLFQPQHFKK